MTTELNLIAREYASRGVQVLECAFNEDAVASLPEFLQALLAPLPGRVGHDGIGDGLPAAGDRPISGRCTCRTWSSWTATGVIRADFPGEDTFFLNAPANIRAQLEKMLKPAAAGRNPRQEGDYLGKTLTSVT